MKFPHKKKKTKKFQNKFQKQKKKNKSLISFSLDITGRTPFLYAARHDKIKILRILTEVKKKKNFSKKKKKNLKFYFK